MRGRIASLFHLLGGTVSQGRQCSSSRQRRDSGTREARLQQYNMSGVSTATDLQSVHSSAEEGFGFGGHQYNASASTGIAGDTQHQYFGHEPANIFRFEIHHT
jgi:hypothetical protein